MFPNIRIRSVERLENRRDFRVLNLILLVLEHVLFPLMIDAIEKMRTEPSQFGNSGVYSFGKAKRRGDRAKDTPGPGAYTQFS